MRDDVGRRIDRPAAAAAARTRIAQSRSLSARSSSGRAAVAIELDERREDRRARDVGRILLGALVRAAPAPRRRLATSSAPGRWPPPAARPDRRRSARAMSVALGARRLSGDERRQHRRDDPLIRVVEHHASGAARRVRRRACRARSPAPRARSSADRDRARRSPSGTCRDRRAPAPVSAAARIDGHDSVSRSTNRSASRGAPQLSERGHRLEPQVGIDRSRSSATLISGSTACVGAERGQRARGLDAHRRRLVGVAQQRHERRNRARLLDRRRARARQTRA